MQSKIIMLAPEGNPEATLLVRRSNGQFALTRIDARVAQAARAAAAYPSKNTQSSAVLIY